MLSKISKLQENEQERLWKYIRKTYVFFFCLATNNPPPNKNLSLYSSILKGTYTDQIEPTGLRFGHNVTSEKLTGRYGSAVLVQLDPILYCSPLCNSDWGLWGFSQILSCIMLTVESDSSGIKNTNTFWKRQASQSKFDWQIVPLFMRHLLCQKLCNGRKETTNHVVSPAPTFMYQYFIQKKVFPTPTPLQAPSPPFPCPGCTLDVEYLTFGSRLMPGSM